MDDGRSELTRSAEPRAVVASAIDAFKRGARREEAFRVLFERYYSVVRRFFAGKGLPPEDCLDLTQDTFLRVYEGLESYRGEASFETWLFKIATNVFLKRLETRATGKRAGAPVSLESLEGTEEPLREPASQLNRLLSDEAVARLRAAAHELPPQMRRCLKLRLDQDLSYRQIAVLMRLSVETVKAHLFQARGKLREKLQDLYQVELDA